MLHIGTQQSIVDFKGGSLFRGWTVAVIMENERKKAELEEVLGRECWHYRGEINRKKRLEKPVFQLRFPTLRKCDSLDMSQSHSIKIESQVGF